MVLKEICKKESGVLRGENKIHKNRIIDIPPKWLQSFKSVKWPRYPEDHLAFQGDHLPTEMMFEKELSQEKDIALSGKKIFNFE